MRTAERLRRPPEPEIPPDPFHEQRPAPLRRQMRLLGADFAFECGNPALTRLVDQAYVGLPRHTLCRNPPRLRVSLLSAPRERSRPRSEPPRIEMLSGAGFLCGTTSSATFATVSPDYRSALVVVADDMMEFPYQTRYELIEFTVFTLASRAQRLLPLHAACVAVEGRGALLLGDSGAGKSTASMHCLLRGMEFVSEDSLFVTPETLLLTGVANFLHVQGGSLRFLPQAIASEVRKAAVIRRRSGVEKFEIDLRARRYRLATKPPKLACLVCLSAESARGGSLLTRLRPREALVRFEASQQYAASQPDWQVFKKHLRTIPAFELRRGRHPAESAEVLQRLLTERY